MEKFSDRRKIHNKIVAFLLALLIAVTPLLSNVGGKSGVKAETHVAVNATYLLSGFSVSGSATCTGTKKLEDGKVVNCTDDTNKTTISCTNADTLYMMKGDIITLRIPDWTKEYPGTDNNAWEIRCSVTEEKVGDTYMVANALTGLTDNNNGSWKYDGGNIKFTDKTQYFNVYLRYRNNSNANSVMYTLAYTVPLVSVDSEIGAAATNALKTYTSDTYWNYDQQITLSDVKATYKVIDNADGTAKDYTVYFKDEVDALDAVTKSGTSYTVAVPSGSTSKITHTVSVCLGKATTADDASSVTYSDSIDIVSATVNMTNDTTAPTVDVSLMNGADGGASGSSSIDGFNDGTNKNAEAFLTQEQNACYKVVVSDTDSGVGIKSISYDENYYTYTTNTDSAPSEYTVYIPVTKWSADNELVVIDRAGNENKYSLRQVCILESDKFDMEVKLTGIEQSLPSDSTKSLYTNEDGKYGYYNGESAVDAVVTIKTTYTGFTSMVAYNSEQILKNASDLSGTLKLDSDTGKYYYEYTYTVNLRPANGTTKITALTVSLSRTNEDSTTTKTLYGGNFICDSEKPVSPTVKIQYLEDQSYKNYESTYIDTSQDSNGNGITYRLKITGVSDGESTNASGLYGYDETKTDNSSEANVANFIQVSDSADSEWNTVNSSVTYEYDGTDYYYDYHLTDDDLKKIAALTNDDSFSKYVRVRDNAGNIIAKEIKFNKLDTDVKFGEIKLEDENGKTKSFGTEESKKTSVNATYKLYVTVTSAHPLYTETGKAYASSLSNANDTFTLNEKKTIFGTVRGTDGRYTSTLVFDIPAGKLDDNAKYESLTLAVKDIRGNEKSETLAQLIYDNSKPYVSSLAYKSGWVKATDATLSYEIVSGSTSSKVESNLTSAGYTLEGTSTSLDVSGKSSVTGSVKMPESTSLAGTTITFTAMDDAGNTISNLNGTMPYTATLFVDGHAPSVTSLTAAGKSTFTEALSGAPVISTGVSDNLALSKIVAVVNYPNGTAKTYTKSYDADNGRGVDITDNYSFQLENTDGKAADGAYTVTVTAYDKAGNASASRTLKFTVDNTVPVLTASIAGGTKGGKQTRNDGTDYYYSSNVPVKLTVVEENFVAGNVTVTDRVGSGSANKVDVTWTKSGDAYVATYTAVGEGRHVISISAVDPTGNQAASKSVEFVIDKTSPTLSFTLNGLAYTESRGLVYLTTDAQLTAAVSDMTDDANDFNIQIIKKQPDQAATTPSYLKTANRSFSFSDEADYTINVYSADMANNKSMVRTITFRVDKTAPELSISGAAGGGTSANETAVTFSMREAFWQDATGQVTIYRKAGDGKEESLYKTIDITPTAYLSSVTENLSETGVYRFEFTATDKAGHKVETSQSYTIDRDAPLVSLTGVNNYDITDQSVQFMAQITDDFYSSKTVTLKGTVTGADGKKKNIDFGSFNQSGNPTVISQEFTDDGVYDIEVTSTDAAGNSHSSKVHFTIDKTEPEIGEIKILDGSVINAVDLDFDLDELISDLTVCDVHMYLNGSEYDGVSDIEDGSYTLLITAEDEMGHYVEKTISFVLDTKAPVFIVTGVEDGDVKNETYSIDVSLQLAEDTLSSVTLNGESVDVTDNTASLTVSEQGDYTLEMSAVDEAGNTANQKISFTYGEEKTASNWWIWLIIVAAIIIIGFTVYATVKKNEKEQ